MSSSVVAPVRPDSPRFPTQAQPVKLQRYQSARKPTVWLAAVVLVSLLAGLIYFGTKTGENDTLGNTPSPTTSSPTHTPPASGLAVEFHSPRDDLYGYWEILEWKWDNHGVLVTMRVTLDNDGTMGFGWFALDNDNADYWYPDATRSTIATGSVQRPNPITGTVYFEIPRGKLTVYLCDSRKNPLTGLVVPE
jgi:hypothetical protein